MTLIAAMTPMTSHKVLEECVGGSFVRTVFEADFFKESDFEEAFFRAAFVEEAFLAAPFFEAAGLGAVLAFLGPITEKRKGKKFLLVLP